MNWAYYLTGFGLGTFKFLFSHWSIHLAANEFEKQLNYLELFLPPTLGAIITMTTCYFASEWLMNRAIRKKAAQQKKMIAEGITPKYKKKFTLINKLIVRTKMRLGLFGITLLASLFLSIPIGAIVCAKFYRHHTKTFPLMLATVVGYSALMSGVILLIYT